MDLDVYNFRSKLYNTKQNTYFHELKNNKISSVERIAQIILLLLTVMQYFEHFRFMPFTITQVTGFALAGVFFLDLHIWMRPNAVFWNLFNFNIIFIYSTMWYLNELSIFNQELAIGKIITLVQCLVLFYFCFCLFEREQTQRFFLSAVFLGALISSCLTLLGIGLTERVGVARFSFGGLDENIMAGLIGLGIIGGIYLLFDNKNKFTKICIGSGLIIMIMFLTSTGSRGGMLATAVGIVGYFGYSRKKTKWVLGIIVLAILLWQISSSEMASSRWENTIQTGDTANRENIFYSSWQLFIDNIWIGRGDINSYNKLGIRFGQAEVGFHNEILWVLCSTGVIGACFIFQVLWKICKNVWSDHISWRSGVSMAYLLLVGVLILSLEIHHQKIFWIILAFLARGSIHKNKTIERYNSSSTKVSTL